MFLNLPDRIFFEKEITRKILQQNNHDWGWYFWITTNDTGLNINWTDNNIGNANYIILEPLDRTNRNITFDIKITSDPGGTNTMYSYIQESEMVFEENLTWVDTYYPSPKHFRWKLSDGSDNPDFKLNDIPLTSNNPNWNVDRNEWRGYQCIGTRIWTYASVIEIPIDNFIPDTITSWNYAILRGHWLDHNTNLLYKYQDGTIKPISWAHSNHEFEFVMKPGESLLYTCYNDGYGRGFGITYIQIFE